MVSEITIQALDSSSSTTGSAITIYAREIDDARTNKTFIINPAQSPQQHSLGPQTNIIVNLLRIQRTIVFTGFITATSSQTAKQVKTDLVNIYTGVTGGDSNKGVRLVYDGENIDGVIEKLAINEKPQDYDPSAFPDSGSINTEDLKEKAYLTGTAKYTVQITFVQGVPQ